MAIVKPRLKKTNSKNEDFLSYRPKRKYLRAYRKFFSTETALVKVTNDLPLNLDQTESTFYIELGLLAAFDSLDHELLLSIFETSLVFKDKVLSFLNNYLIPKSVDLW